MSMTLRVGPMTSNTRIDLKVPYTEKEQAKVHGPAAGLGQANVLRLTRPDLSPDRLAISRIVHQDDPAGHLPEHHRSLSVAFHVLVDVIE